MISNQIRLKSEKIFYILTIFSTLFTFSGNEKQRSVQKM